MSAACACCGADGVHRLHSAREMMFGLGGAFTYRECAGCGCLELQDPPADPAPFYPADYYSYRRGAGRRLERLDAWLKRHRARACLEGGDPLGSLLMRAFGVPAQLRWARRLGIGRRDAVLDVGCGAGELLRELQRDGFRRLAGIDPYLAGDLDLGGGLVVRRRGLDDVVERYDLVMLHHVLEHLPDQRRAFAQLRRVVKPRGALLVRVPVADSLAWRRYGADWVQLDAPRHLVLHTRRSLERLAAGAGFALEGSEDDGTAFQFWGSEQYRRGIPLRDPRSHATAPRRSPFTRDELAGFDREAAQANRDGTSDQAVFYFRRDDGADDSPPAPG